MTNKEYKEKRHDHETAPELFAFEHYNGWYVSRMMGTEDKRNLRKEYKEDAKSGAFILDGFNGRAVIIPVSRGYILKSYYTPVAAIIDGTFYKTWEGYSVTTMKHINAFCAAFGVPGFNKKEWVALETVGDIVDGETGEILNAA